MKLALTMMLLVAAFQNCGDGFGVKAANSTLISSVNVPTPTATTANSYEVKTWESPFPAAVRADDCLTNTNFNICLTYKDPVTTVNQIFTPALSPGNATVAIDAKIFLYGLKVPVTTTLENANFKITTDGYTAVGLTSRGDWKHSYKTDTNHKIAQLSTWYIINREREYFIERTGSFHFSAATTGSKLIIHSYRPDLQDNAFFDPDDTSVNFGYISGTSGDVGVDQAVVAHEMGHANFFAASANSLHDTNAKSCFSTAACCKTVNGCVLGIHEGVGDFHAMIMFPDQGGSIGDYMENSLTGILDRNLDRAVSQARTAAYYYGLHTGEIHDVGSTYASIWYSVWKDAKANKQEQDIEVLFNEHLSGLGGSDTFLTAYTTIATLADQLYPAKSAAIKASFRTQYTRLGLTLPN